MHCCVSRSQIFISLCSTVIWNNNEIVLNNVAEWERVIYLSKLCWFTKVIRSFRFSVKISLGHKQLLHSCIWIHSEFCTSVMTNYLVWPWTCLPQVCKNGLTHTYTQAETHQTFLLRSVHTGSPSLLYGSRTVVPSLHSCLIVVILFEISRATSDTHCSLTCQPWQRSALYIYLCCKDSNDYSAL